MLRAGFHCKAAIDFNHDAIVTLQVNLKDNLPPASGLTPVEHAFERDLTKFSPQELEAIIKTQKIDVIVGGPPCQGFSTQGKNHGSRFKQEDPRRHLYRQFLDYVEHFQPKIFVIENVLGIRTAAGGKYFTAVQHEARILGKDKGLLGYRVHGQIEKAEDFGVPQKRRRQLIIGIRADLPGYLYGDLKPAKHAMLGTMLGDAIGDLPTLKAGEGTHIAKYDVQRRERKFLHGARDKYRLNYLINIAQVERTGILTNHVARPHNARDIRDFQRLGEGINSSVAMRNGIRFEFPYDKENFKDRYTRQHRNRLCSTIVAHLGKDGLMFIHPTQDRSLTPREAARVQTFPDWFVFPEARTHAFRMIGNAVPPLIGEAVGNTILDFLTKLKAANLNTKSADNVFIPENDPEAVIRLAAAAVLSPKELQMLPLDGFLKSWHALFWLFPGLHPDNALDHGKQTATWTEANKIMPDIPTESQKYHVRSGWPVPLTGIGDEAWRRYESREITDDEFYCAEAQHAGICWHANMKLEDEIS